MLGSFNIICCVVGVGLLGLPYALSQSGWIGIPLLILTCVMSTFTCAILGDAIDVCIDGDFANEHKSGRSPHNGFFLIKVVFGELAVGGVQIPLETGSSGSF